MSKLIYDEKEMGWRCSCCDAIYSDEEIHRMFNYDKYTEDCFSPSYCMDCGSLLDEVDMKNYT